MILNDYSDAYTERERKKGDLEEKQREEIRKQRSLKILKICLKRRRQRIIRGLLDDESLTTAIQMQSKGHSSKILEVVLATLNPLSPLLGLRVINPASSLIIKDKKLGAFEADTGVVSHRFGHRESRRSHLTPSKTSITMSWDMIPYPCRLPTM